MLTLFGSVNFIKEKKFIGVNNTSADNFTSENNASVDKFYQKKKISVQTLVNFVKKRKKTKLTSIYVSNFCFFTGTYTICADKFLN